MSVESDSVRESCRAAREEAPGGGTREGERRSETAAAAVLQESEIGSEVNEGALWQCYREVAPYLTENPDAWRQDSRMRLGSEGEEAA